MSKVTECYRCGGNMSPVKRVKDNKVYVYAMSCEECTLIEPKLEVTMSEYNAIKAGYSELSKNW